MAEISGNNMAKTKRKRSANWDSIEKSVLKTCMKEFISIIENKNTDTNTNKCKTGAWHSVTQRFNELNNRERDIAEIKQQWRTMKPEAKKNMSHIKTSISCTGGGPKPPSPSYDTLEIISMIPQEFETDSNVFDSDGFGFGTDAKKQELESEPTPSITQEFVLTPLDNSENANENMLSSKRKASSQKGVGKKRRLFESTQKDELAKERNDVLINCMREEHDTKMNNMAAVHAFNVEEHQLKMKQMVELQDVLKKESELRVQILKLELSLLQSKINT